ncbi:MULTISPECIES: hypothetical protein [Helicobacter]|uniref:indole-3-glycerol-phosphate synthase n=1 Tax=Helicobacter ibis TaxID=2962633 RepID=A0ABT4VCP0_9HELI|nr:MULTISPECIES: hypothetical protein [Helicobacter]MDA3966751.1 hypothetical protein [Helicobacter sp. WB40]MDA3968467.1 hypothetical protein [Helicobacter ibis]
MNLKTLQNRIDKKKKSYPMEWLGRSLAYTPYQPRELKDSFKKTQTFTPKQIIKLLDDDFLNIAKSKEQVVSAFMLESLDNLAYIRRYTNIPLIYDFIIIDEYQILESLVYGSDAIVLRADILNQKELKNLSDFALKLGLERIFKINSKNDLTKAIFAKSDILLVENENLIELIPNNKIIISSTINDNSIDTNII